MASPDGLGSYLDLSTDYYQTYQHENWQHPGSDGWSGANVPGWGNNPNLQMFARRGVGEDSSGMSETTKSFAILGVLLIGVVVLAKASKTNIFGW